MQLVIGNKGEVGSAVQAVLECKGIDQGQRFKGQVDVLHICIPFSERFVEIVGGYNSIYSPSLIVIHSTVPVGTSEQLNAVHSPIRGVHPNLEGGIRTFVKYFGGKNAHKAAMLFAEKGVKVKVVKSSRTTEAMKLMSTTQYGLNIMIEKVIHEWCLEHDVDFDIVYTDANKTYNAGYIELGRPDVVRPWLKHIPGKIGGHCVIPNLDLVKEFWFAELLQTLNKDFE